MNLPIHLQNRQRRDLVSAAIGGINSGSPAHISIAGNRFTLVDDAGNEKPVQTLFLDVCVIDANPAVSKIYFDPRVPYEPGGDNSNPPICWSDNGIGASAQASQPQNSSCQLCPHNAWGSATSKATGKPIKACNDVKKVAVVVPGIDVVFLLRIPPASLKNWGKYCQTLGGHGVDLPDAVTRLEFESQGVLKFTPMGYVDEPTAATTDKVLNAKGTDQLIGRNDRPWTGQADASKIAYAAQAEPQRQVVAPPAPVQRQGRAFGQTAAAPVAALFAQGAANPAPGPFVGAAETPAPARKPRGPNKPKETPQADDGGLPPFLQRNAPLAAAAAPNPNPNPNPTQFGMQPNAPAPDAGVQAALDAAFRLPV